MSMLIRALAAGLAFVAPFVSPAQAQQKEVTIGIFPGGFNLPNWIAEKKGFFAREGLAPKFFATPTSVKLIQEIVVGNVQIYVGAVDNVVAYREGQGATPVPDDFDLTAIFGSDSSFLSLIAVPEVKTLADLKDKTLAVDAMTTGFAFVARELVARAGYKEDDVKFVASGGTAGRFKALMERKFDATITQVPFDFIAMERGFTRVVGVAETLGAYQGRAAAVRAAWAKENKATVIGFIRAYRSAVEWMHDPKNRTEAIAILAAGEPELTPALVEKSLDYMTGPDGFRRDLSFDEKGFRTVMDLRSKFAKPEKKLTDWRKYIDPSYLAEATKAGG
jgi:ABC-type nitrate/sulfonate/bicarbonate transport system substrate-binding protein